MIRYDASERCLSSYFLFVFVVDEDVEAKIVRHGILMVMRRRVTRAFLDCCLFLLLLLLVLQKRWGMGGRSATKALISKSVMFDLRWLCAVSLIYFTILLFEDVFAGGVGRD